ncbi:MAG: HAMP domain-containing sensor histidine kinase [Clostridium sp.]
MKQKGLFSKMIASSIIIISISFIMVATIMSIWFDSHMMSIKKDNIIKQLDVVNDLVVRYSYDDVSLDNLENSIEFIAKYLEADIWILDKAGYLYSTSNYNQIDYIGQQMMSDDLKELEENDVIDHKGYYNEVYDKSVYTVAVPAKTYYGEFVGVIVVNSSMEQVTQSLKSIYKIIWILALLFISLWYIVLYWFSQKYIVKPLDEINSTAKKIAIGEVERRVNINSDDEIGELAHSFNYMADFLEKNENNRRRFISDVSHEIRSPITSIKGFIGAVLDGVIPSGKQNQYLAMAYEETNRLTRLVNNLLDLSALESGKQSLKYEELDINELIRLTVLKFETKISERDLKINVFFDTEKLSVMADRDKLIQVLVNLVDNAIKYASDGGNVKVDVRTKGKKALISIYNDGEAIKEEHIKHIWQRFYKADKSRTSKVSTGLGLPIVREIMTQFGEDIWVVNKDSGVCFNFTLKRV